MEKKKTAPDRLFFICTAVVLLAVLVLFFYGAFIPDSILFGHDTINIYMPFKIFAKEVTSKFHDIPLWMPNLFFGFL